MGSQRLFPGPSEKSLPPTSSHGEAGGVGWQSFAALAPPYPEQFLSQLFP